MFQSLSHLKINFTIFHALNVSLLQSLVELCKTNFPFIWHSKSISYLGIQIPANLMDLYSCNFTPLLNTIKQNLLKWNNLNFFWFGRVATLKMNILPKILNLMQAVPVSLPKAFFSEINRLFSGLYLAEYSSAC